MKGRAARARAAREGAARGRSIGREPVVVSLASMLAIWALSVVLLFVQHDAATAQAKANNENLSALVGELVSYYFRDRFLNVKLLASFEDRPDAGGMDEIEAFFRNFPYYESIVILDTEGIVRRTVPPDEDLVGFDFSARSFFLDARPDLITLSEVYTSLATGKAIITCSIRAATSIIAANLDISNLAEALGKIKPSQYSRLAVLDKDGRYIYHPDMSYVITKRINFRYNELFGRRKPEGTVHYEELVDGRKNLVTASPVESTGWTVLVYYDYRAEMARTLAYLEASVALLVLFLCLSFALSYRSIRQITRVIGEFAARTERIARGDREAGLGKVDYLEFQPLAANFDAMTRSVSEREEDLLERERMLADLIDAAPYPITVRRRSDGAFLLVNEAICRLHGTSKEVFYDEAKRGEAFPEIPGGLGRLREELARNGHIRQMELAGRDPSGRATWHSVSVVPVTYRKEACWLTNSIDITDLKESEEKLLRLNAELESKVAERTGELSKANADLRESNDELGRALETLKLTQSTLVVSEKMTALGRISAGLAHELNTPLGAIESNLQLIMRSLDRDLDGAIDLFAALGPEGRAFVKKASGAAIGLDYAEGFPDPSELRKERRRVEGILEDRSCADAFTVADTLVSLGLAGLAEEAAELLAGREGEAVLTALRGLVEPIHAAKVASLALDQASQVSRALRSYFSGCSSEAPEAIPLAAQFRSVFALFRNRLKRGIRVSVEIEESMTVWGKSEELSRVWFNLLSNAVQALEGEGSITVSAAGEGGRVVVHVVDSGHGIPEAIQDQVFSPFFTTRPLGEGSGLGLDIARRLVEANGGSIRFTSSPGHTDFVVILDAPPSER